MTTTGSMRNPHLRRPDIENDIDMLAGDLHAELKRLDAIAAELKTAKGAVWLEFLDSTGSEPVIGATHLHGPQWKAYDGPIPNTGDVIVVDYGLRLRVVERILYFLPNVPNVKMSLHCAELPWRQP